jgi:hypothetical protein
MRGDTVRRHRAVIGSVVALATIAAMVAVSGCARGGEGADPIVPARVLEFIIRFKGGIIDNFYYFVAIDTDNDSGLDGQV